MHSNMKLLKRVLNLMLAQSLKANQDSGPRPKEARDRMNGKSVHQRELWGTKT